MQVIGLLLRKLRKAILAVMPLPRLVEAGAAPENPPRPIRGYTPAGIRREADIRYYL